jgi:two-component system chemotaxis response regulator CheB
MVSIKKGETLPGAVHLELVKRKVVVIGASLGGVAAIPSLISQLPADFPAPVLVVLHIDAHRSYLPRLISARGVLPAAHAVDGETIVAGRVYVAPPDAHLLLDGDVLRLYQGPKENHSRPAIDPLFRSAALSRGKDVIGVVLTGMLDDGTAGLQAIKQGGGVAIVQHPQDAVAPSMPQSALRYVSVDHCVTIDAISGLLMQLVDRPAANDSVMEDEAGMKEEHLLSLGIGDPMARLRLIAEPSPFVCPECKGSLWALDDSLPTRFRCHTGHGYTVGSLEHDQSRVTDETMWAALRALQEKSALLRKVASDNAASGHLEEAEQLRHDAALVDHHAAQLRVLLSTLPGSAARADGAS